MRKEVAIASQVEVRDLARGGETSHGPGRIARAEPRFSRGHVFSIPDFLHRTPFHDVVRFVRFCIKIYDKNSSKSTIKSEMSFKKHGKSEYVRRR